MMADRAAFLTLPAEVVGQLESVERDIGACESLDMQKLASTSGAEGERFDAHLDAAQLYVDLSRYVKALARIVCLCEGKAEASPTSDLRKSQERIDKARARYERHLKAKKGDLTLGIDDANKVIAAVSKSKRKAQATGPIKVDTKRQGPSKKHKGRNATEKHRTMAFLDEMKKPT